MSRVTLNPYNVDLSKILDPSDYIVHYNYNYSEYYDEQGVYKSEILGEFIRANLYIATYIPIYIYSIFIIICYSFMVHSFHKAYTRH